MRKITQFFLASMLALAVIGPGGSGGAMAGWHGGPRPGWGPPHPHFGWGPGPDVGSAVIGGVLGFLAGRATSEPSAPTPPPAPIVTIRPWTNEWYDYCNAKYRSFDARTGYFVGYDGQQHFCR